MINISSDFVTTHWPLSQVQIGPLLKQSGGRLVYEIMAKEGKFILKVTDKSKTKEDLERDTFIFQFLKDVGFSHSPFLLKTKSGENFIQKDNAFIYLQEYIEGQIPESSIANHQKLGEITAKIHQIKDYPHQTSFTIESIKSDLIKTAESVPFKKEYEALIDSLPDPSGLPECLIHTDIGLHNTIQKPSGELILVDWDDAGVGKRILDIAFPLISQFVTYDLVFREDDARAFYKTYMDHNELTDQEKELLFNASLFFTLMYLPYGDIDKNWKRVQFALENKGEIISVLS